MDEAPEGFVIALALAKQESLSFRQEQEKKPPAGFFFLLLSRDFDALPTAIRRDIATRCTLLIYRVLHHVLQGYWSPERTILT